MSAAPWDRFARWVWQDGGVRAGAARAALAPIAALYRLGTMARNAAYDAGALASGPLPIPAIGVGNLAVGGTGKTPLAAFLARELDRRGVRVALLLRGYGADEAAEYGVSAPRARVEAGADRHAGAARAVAGGAQALVLDDCLQRRDVVVDVMLAVVAAETWPGTHWPLPAGPWREGVDALARAAAVVVTRKTAPAAAAHALAASLERRAGGVGLVAELAPGRLEPLGGGPETPLGSLHGRRVLAACGIGAPEAFAGQLEAAGAIVEVAAFGDHHRYTPRDVAVLAARAGGRPVVTTGKDAPKLAALWPADGPPCLVAALDVRITRGAEWLDRLLDRVAGAARTHPSTEAALEPLQRS